jgi:thiol-disulfide isomerase/thioredoxin
MRFVLISAALVTACFGPLAAQEQRIVAQAQADAGTAQFDAVLRQALGTLVQAGSYAVDVDSKWGAVGDPEGPHGGSHYRLTAQGSKYRVEVQSHGTQSPELVCVNDGAHVTTFFPARKLYSQHAADSLAASLEANKMLALSLQGSALDILLQRDVAAAVHSQASELKDHGQATLDGKKTHQFEVTWGGAKVELWFAAEGSPLLVQFTRTTSVPTGMNQHYQMSCTAKFKWQIGAAPAANTFVLAVPADAHRVNEIYDALSGEAVATRVNRALPKLQLAKLDGSDVELTVTPGKKATVLIFWASWCAASVEDMPAVHKFVAAYKDRGVDFYAVNVGEQPGEVRRFTAKHPLVSTVLLDPRGKVSSELRVTELPAVAIVAPDNTIRAILHGSAKELQAELTTQLDGLLTGAANSTARKPSESTARPK